MLKLLKEIKYDHTRMNTSIVLFGARLKEKDFLSVSLALAFVKLKRRVKTEKIIFLGHLPVTIADTS